MKCWQRVPGQVGNPLANCHPEKSYKNVEWVIQQLRSGATDAVRVHVPKQVAREIHCPQLPSHA